MPLSLTAGFTVRELARRWRVSRDRIRGFIKRGELAAINTAPSRAGRPRYIVTPEAVAAFERARSAAPPPTPPRRQKRTQLVDFYPD
jgi:hypothetical protein